jgi:folate-binding protein YgfZ
MARRTSDDDLARQVDALDADRAFAELVGWRLVEVGGGDARAWLHDLVTADIASLTTGSARRSLILTPTGRIRADVQVIARGDGFLLLQAPDQPEPVERILAPYVLSSDVELDDVSDQVRAFAVLGGGAADDGVESWTPSPLGSGWAVAVAPGEADAIRDRLAATPLTEVSPPAIERWRIRRGIARMGADFGADALPAEAGLEGVIDFSKGCFLGQESVAKVRNLGHPPRAIVSVGSKAPLEVGMTVRAGEREVGEVTSVAVGPDVRGIVKVRWDAAGEPLATQAGPLFLR